MENTDDARINEISALKMSLLLIGKEKAAATQLK